MSQFSEERSFAKARRSHSATVPQRDSNLSNFNPLMRGNDESIGTNRFGDQITAKFNVV